jgi:hypothetical protein
VKAVIIGIRTLADYSVGLKDSQHADTQQQCCSEFKPALQYNETPDDHGVNSADGPARLSTTALS